MSEDTDSDSQQGTYLLAVICDYMYIYCKEVCHHQYDYQWLNYPNTVAYHLAHHRVLIFFKRITANIYPKPYIVDILQKQHC